MHVSVRWNAWQRSFQCTWPRMEEFQWQVWRRGMWATWHMASMLLLSRVETAERARKREAAVWKRSYKFQWRLHPRRRTWCLDVLRGLHHDFFHLVLCGIVTSAPLFTTFTELAVYVPNCLILLHWQIIAYLLCTMTFWLFSSALKCVSS